MLSGKCQSSSGWRQNPWLLCQGPAQKPSPWPRCPHWLLDFSVTQPTSQTAHAHTQLPGEANCGLTGQEVPLCRGRLVLTRTLTHSCCPLHSPGLTTTPPWLQEQLTVQGTRALLGWALVTAPQDRMDALLVSAAVSQFFLSSLSNTISVSQKWDQ